MLHLRLFSAPASQPRYSTRRQAWALKLGVLSLMRSRIPRCLPAITAGCLALSSCGEGNPFGLLGPEDVDLSGSWTYNSPNLVGTLTGSAVTCSVSGMTLSLTQTGTAFSGTAAGGTFTCFDGSTPRSQPIAAVVANGQIDGKTVRFDFNAPNWRHTGTVSGSAMSGSVTLVLEDLVATVTLTGQWSSARRASPPSPS